MVLTRTWLLVYLRSKYLVRVQTCEPPKFNIITCEDWPLLFMQRAIIFFSFLFYTWMRTYTDTVP